MNKINKVLTELIEKVNKEITDVEDNDYYTKDLKENVIKGLNTAKSFIVIETKKDNHDSDCANHNEPAYRNETCDCFLSK